MSDYSRYYAARYDGAWALMLAGRVIVYGLDRENAESAAAELNQATDNLVMRPRPHDAEEDEPVLHGGRP